MPHKGTSLSVGTVEIFYVFKGQTYFLIFESNIWKLDFGHISPLLYVQWPYKFG